MRIHAARTTSILVRARQLTALKLYVIFLASKSVGLWIVKNGGCLREKWGMDRTYQRWCSKFVTCVAPSLLFLEEIVTTFSFDVYLLFWKPNIFRSSFVTVSNQIWNMEEAFLSSTSTRNKPGNFEVFFVWHSINVSISALPCRQGTLSHKSFLSHAFKVCIGIMRLIACFGVSCSTPSAHKRRRMLNIKISTRSFFNIISHGNWLRNLGSFVSVEDIITVRVVARLSMSQLHRLID